MERQYFGIDNNQIAKSSSLYNESGLIPDSVMRIRAMEVRKTEVVKFESKLKP